MIDNGWQPIITAPDDEEVLVWVVNARYKTAERRIGYKEVIENECRWITPIGQSIEILDDVITHWQPLPPPPNQTPVVENKLGELDKSADKSLTAATGSPTNVGGRQL